MKPYLKILLPVLVLVGAVLASRAILGSRPEPVTRPERVTLQSVEAMRLVPGDYPVVLRSRGSVRPTRANTLVAEVTGSVTALADAFVLGGAFARGETLVQLDRRDHEIARTRARANLAQARARLEEQEALAEQARLEWRQLGRRGEPSALTLREPQLAAARADRDAAAAELERAELDLERTRVTAPYDGRVLEREVDAGQFVNRGGVLGRIHAIDSVEVSLPLGVREQTRLELPADGRAPAVELEAPSGGATRRWAGELVRVAGVDEATRQLAVIARVDDPWADADAPLRVGQYVEARISGEVLRGVFVVPRTAVREGREVLVVDRTGAIRRRPVVVAWSDEDVAAIDAGLEAGELVVLTPLATVVDGTPVRAIVDGVELELPGSSAPSDRAESLDGSDPSRPLEREPEPKAGPLHVDRPVGGDG